ncbi:phage antirepressor KilAC domain-containing protein [Zooshikella harenae]|uniref:Phage antirepressor KilAC domain-containing protein n=1 Tax=Zooshikella harenae TaxID=2827238 RepID=A0ABS5ZI75_9GAMM|nr:phage antirepressor KilAC domain-containing protein [Zooshikella harenae]MBU2713665.1 phage antirepressor KilAC domain-containing protein [Zooshikella harenae]
MLPNAEAFDIIVVNNEIFCVINAAKDLQMKPKDLFSWFSTNIWIYLHPDASGWIVYQDKRGFSFLNYSDRTAGWG